MNFETIKDFAIPEGNVTKLAINGVTAWEKKDGIPINTLPVGSSVFMNVNGTPREFLVVHQGIPDATLYDASCNGTWLLMKKLINEYRAWSSSSTATNYANSSVHAYLNNQFLGFFDSDIQGAIKQIKIPYRNGIGTSTTISSGADGLSTRVFILSAYEVGYTNLSSVIDGAILSYFSGDGNTDNNRFAYVDNGGGGTWHLRTPDIKYSAKEKVYAIAGSGGYLTSISPTDKWFVRPAIILPSNAMVDEEFNVIG